MTSGQDRAAWGTRSARQMSRDRMQGFMGSAQERGLQARGKAGFEIVACQARWIPLVLSDPQGQLAQERGISS